ncbi:DUF4349 domain-containing protein [Sphaerisporangium sp. NPDC088356]|uniref:DUF4349 domain-containing protein n=1 Tax=Sphaerisporangium sp. NPDC088356 TaxID=3154871 RepID=UPI0034248681
MSRLRSRPSLMVTLAAVVLAISACGGSQDLSQSSSGAAPAAPAVESQADAPAGTSQGGSEATVQDSGARSPSDSSKVEVKQADQAIVYTGEMSVRVKDVTVAANRAKQIVSAAGGRVDSEQSTSYGREARSSIVFKIPPDRYPAVVDQLGKDLGVRESLSLGTEDVSQQIADVGSRVKSSKSALGQVRKFMAKAKTIPQVLEVEREISTREADLESLQARQRTLAAQTALGTMTIHLVHVTRLAPKPAKPKPEPPNFLSGLKTGWHALATTTRIALTVFGALLPWLVVLGVLWIAYMAVRRRVPSLWSPAATRRPAPDAPRTPEAHGEPDSAPEPDVPGEPDERPYVPERPGASERADVHEQDVPEDGHEPEGPRER